MVIEIVTNSNEDTQPNTRQLLLAALENRWKNYRKELKRCRDEFSFEAVHDLRTATRRVLALIQLLNSIVPRPRLQKLIRSFKDQLDTFDDLRDVQVILAEISEVIQEFPQLEPFQKHMRHMEQKTLRQVRKDIKTLETVDLKKRIRKTHETFETDTTDDLESEILRAVDDAYLATKQRFSRVDLAYPATIHRVRTAFKSFRYMMDVIHPLLRNFPAENLQWMNDYQSLMGEIQDLNVFTQTLADYSESASLPDLEPVHRYYEQRRTEAISAYVKEMNYLYSFWRAKPEQPFPWEKTS